MQQITPADGAPVIDGSPVVPSRPPAPEGAARYSDHPTLAPMPSAPAVPRSGPTYYAPSPSATGTQVPIVVQVPDRINPGELIVVEPETGHVEGLIISPRDAVAAVPPPIPTPTPIWAQQNVLTGLSVPVAVILVTAGCKLLAIRNRKTGWEDYLFGIDATIAAMASSMVRLIELFFAHRRAAAIVDPTARDTARTLLFDQFAASGGFFVVVLIALLGVLLIHHKWLVPLREKGTAQANIEFRRQFWLLYVGNAIGLGTLFTVILILRIPCDL